MKKHGFTLAEILITLAIIGIIAAMVLSSLTTRYEKYKAVTQLRQAYKILSTVIQQSVVDNGEPDSWNYNLNVPDFDQKYILPYLKISKICKNGECEITDGFYGYYQLSGQRYTNIQASYVLSNGMVLMTNKDTNCLVYIVDTNGNKRPNTMGKDIFVFYLYSPGYSARLYPGALDWTREPHFLMNRKQLLTSTSRSCSKSSNDYHGGGGGACTALIVKDGWKIADDYPW